MSRASPWTPANLQPDCREDKKRRLPQGHTGKVVSSSGSAHEDLDDMFASLSIDSVLAQENSGDRSKERKRKSCQESAGNLTNALSDDVLENMFASLSIDSRVTSTASTRSGKGSFIILDDNILAGGNSDCTTSTDSRRPRSEVFIERVNDLLLHHDGTGVRVFEVRFDLNSTHAAHLDKWVQFASEAGAQDVKLSLCKDMTSCPEHLVTANRYNFPLHCFGDGRQRSSMRKLDLTNCIFTPPLDSSAFSSLVCLYLVRATITDAGVQNICSCCPILRHLRLARCDDLVNVRISHEVLICLDIFRCKKLVSVEIHATCLLIFEYDGHEVHINYASTPSMRFLANNFKNRNSYLSDGVEAMKRIRKITLTFLWPSEKPSYTLYAIKFPALQFINLFILPSWNNVRGVAYLVKATPCLKRLRLEARSGDHHYRDDIQVSWPEGISLKRLRFITVGGFAAQAPLVELLVCLVHAGARSRRTYLQIDPHHHLCKGLGRWVREEDVGDKPARDRAREAARETLRSRLPPSVKLVIK
ncbi:uncharacterized protein LOC125526921 [Triticum urartu]|uniref:uncharacterized protein LOC125510821 n=1 Tax=Triticum urartu TaxID=4572 RepID=UPI002044B71B|nr:uncharacterized protein LOC125510821 [Triticum urartu]XP_048547477.1 uncharacterized protein LOC125526921 [Triticum urartu]